MVDQKEGETPLTDAERLEKGEIQFTGMIEIVGAPKDHIEKTAKLVVENMQKRDYMDLREHNVAEVAQQKKLWSTFIEFRGWIKNLTLLMVFCFEFKPSSIEVVDPETKLMKNREVSDVYNDMLGFMHKADMMVKHFRAENHVMKKNWEVLLRNCILLSLTEGDKSIKELEKQLGVKGKILEEILKILTSQNLLEEKNRKYTLLKQLNKD